jgi:hypothetical protein
MPEIPTRILPRTQPLKNRWKDSDAGPNFATWGMKPLFVSCPPNSCGLLVYTPASGSRKTVKHRWQHLVLLQQTASRCDDDG